MKYTIEKQGETLAELKNKITELSEKTSELKLNNEKNNEDILKASRGLDNDKKSNARQFEESSENDSKFGQELLQQKVKLESVTWGRFCSLHIQETMNDALSDLVRNINMFRTELKNILEI